MAEENTPEVFVLFCGVVGLGKLAATQPELFKRVREYASDPRWRIREAVPTGLQLTGDQDMDLLISEMKKWIKGNWYEKRAAAATLAEPRLLKQSKACEAGACKFWTRSLPPWKRMTNQGMRRSRFCGRQWAIAGVWLLLPCLMKGNL